MRDVDTRNVPRRVGTPADELRRRPLGQRDRNGVDATLQRVVGNKTSVPNAQDALEVAAFQSFV